jgi:hypothetical protein
MHESIRTFWAIVFATLGVQILAMGCGGGAEGAPGAVRPWLYGAIWLGWAWLTWRALTMRIRVSPEGIRCRGFWRTRFVAWDDLVEVVSKTDLGPRAQLWEYPSAILFNRHSVRLIGVYGWRREGISQIDRIAERLNALCDES